MVITRLQRAALCVAWSPDESRFAIGSGAMNVCICSHEPANKWWAGKLIRRKHQSSVLCIAWHPNAELLATGSSDNFCRVFHIGKPPITGV
jgi:actin related protein 2/3 complex, subunit 1A/1B